MDVSVRFYEQTGEENTAQTLDIVKQRAGELGIKKVLVASTRGGTAVQAAKVLQGLQVIGVSHSTGFREPNVQQFSEENRQRFEALGGTLLTTTHAFAGVSRAMRNSSGTYVIGDVIASVLRLFGEGMKVAVEITLMAADAGLVRTDEDIIAVAGTGRGSDTAIVLKPVNSHSLFDLKVREILCKPRF